MKMKPRIGCILLVSMGLPILANPPESATTVKTKSYFPSVYSLWEGGSQWLLAGPVLLLLATNSPLLAQGTGEAAADALVLAVEYRQPGASLDHFVLLNDDPAMLVAPREHPAPVEHPAPSVAETQPPPAVDLEKLQVDVMGSGKLAIFDPNSGARALTFGFRAGSTAGPAKGFFTFHDDYTATSFTGTVREVKVLEAAPDGSPQKIICSGVSERRDGTIFSFTLATGKDGEGRMGLSVRSNTMFIEAPLDSIVSGYFYINGQTYKPSN